ncbi:hypothetical protein [Pelagibaculum spongiae]|nr:hypothetical protein [Pelagibaculum spongiae]
MMIYQLRLFCSDNSGELTLRCLDGSISDEPILIDGSAKEKIKLQCDSFFMEYFNKKTIESESVDSAAGVAIIHRIWLGKFPDEQQLLLVAMANRRIAAQWKNKKSVTHYLWTNNPGLLALSDKKLHGVFQIMDIRVLLEQADLVCDVGHRAMSFLAWRQYAYCSDMLRVLLMYFYGGLYLDFSWVNSETNALEDFNPKESSVKLYQKAIDKPELATFYKKPFVLGGDSKEIDYFFNNYRTKNNQSQPSGFFRPSHYIDNNVLYAGRARSAFFSDALHSMNDALSSNDFLKEYGGLLKTVHKSHAVIGADIYHEIAKNVNPGVVSLFFGLIFPSMRHFYQARDNAPLSLELPEENCFYIGQGPKYLKLLPQFGLMKLEQRSWNKMNPALQGSVEAPGWL